MRFAGARFGLEEFNSHLAKALNVSEVDWMQYYMDEVDPIPGCMNY
jgi:hypothetical protein